jgi:anthranilate synthase/aminodeoxychorismate synthase-like glutamine amidotransferase
MLRDYIMQAGQECIVVRNDEKSIEEISGLDFDSIVISPGPKTPSEAGITMDVIRRFWEQKPILGICLGHQAIGEFFGSSLVTACQPMHGKTSIMKHTEHDVFAGIPTETEIMRYHSLILEYVLADDLNVIAAAESGEIMGVSHPDKKIVGLQFHPESVLTPDGLQMIRNWYNYITPQSSKDQQHK